MSLPPYTVWFRGLPACPCLAAWLPVYEAELQRRGILDGPLRIYQLIGNASASADTHSQGGAFDLSDYFGHEDVWVARQMGAPATWERTSPPFTTRHIHGVLQGCPHNGPARYQIAAVYSGFNGLGAGGRGGPDTGPRPIPARTWQQGIKWAQLQGDDMFSDEDRETLEAVATDVRVLTKLTRNKLKALREKVKGGRVDLREVGADVDAILAGMGDDE